MILVVNVCKERLHYYEFVKPILDILGSVEERFFVRHYSEIEKRDLSNCDKIIICGTSLKDNKFVEDIDCFGFLRDFNKPVLGICAGMQILGLVFGGKMKKGFEVGFFKEKFDGEFLGLKGNIEAYHLHNNYVEFSGYWESFSGGEIPQAVMWKNFFGVLFHPEVRNKKMILEFCRL